MIYCPSCGTANRDGSRFCNECGTKLPTMTSSLCPTCGALNPPHSLFCEKCGTRLIASLAEEPEEPEAPAAFVPKGLSLPTKSPAEAQPAPAASAPAEPQKPAEEDLPDWMKVVQSATADTSESAIAKVTAAGKTPDQSASDEVPAWLSGLGLDDQSGQSEKSPADEQLPEWTQRLRAKPEGAQPSAAEEEVPDWLKALGSTGGLPSAEKPEAASEEAPKATNLAAPAGLTASQEEELPEWLKEPATPYFSEPETPPTTAAPTQPAVEEMPDWLRDLRPTTSTEDALPDWLDELGMEEQPASESMALSTGDSALDWLSQLGASAPELPTDQSATPPAETPAWLSGAAQEPQPAEPTTADWMSSLRAAPSEPKPAAPEAAQPPELAAPQQSVTDWLSTLRQAAPEFEAEQAPSEEIPEWLREVQPPVESAEMPSTAQPEEDAPDWLKGLGLPGAEAQPPAEAAPEKPVTDWLSTLRQAAPEIEAEQAPSEEIPEWLREVQPPVESAEMPSTAQPEAEAPDWLKGLGLTGAAAQPPVEAAPEKPVTDWLSTLRQATPEIEAEQAPSEEIPEWLREVQPPVESAEMPSTAPPKAEAPDWLKGLGLPGGDEQPPAEAAPEKPVTDWLSTLRQATPEIGEEPTEAAPQAISGVPGQEQAVPDWLRGAPAEALPSTPSAEEDLPDWLRGAQAPAESAEARSEEEVPEWLKGISAAAAGAAAAGSFVEQRPTEPAPEKPVTDWLASLRQAAPQADEQPTEGEVPDWLKDLGVTTGTTAVGAMAEEQQPAAAAPEKPATDWLSALRRATPEVEEQPPESEPEGLQESAEAAPQVYDKTVPDWLRESPPAPEPAKEEESLPDWLREESGAVAKPVQPPAAAQVEEEGTPDWLKELGAAPTPAPRAEKPSEEGLPDWLREAEPAPAITFETPQEEEAAPGATPDWLRELTPTAGAVKAEPEAEVPEEIEQPEEAVEAEPETKGGVSTAAPVAMTGLAEATLAGPARKPAKTEAAPAEIPEWLKEIRQEQQAARTAIPVPPPEAAGLTQAEIPAWLEALRPKEEAAAPKEAETPSETEGPLAGIANVLPSAPIMGEIHGLPAKLQFAISAEDQARAGVLRELLTQHAVAPAAVEQFAVKGSAMRRRALRWFVTLLIAVALLVPIWVDLNQSTGLTLMPDATNMVVPPANTLAAVEIAKLAQLPAKAKVLVVFDYDAIQAGEMNHVAQALLSSPALRNAQIDIASLNPQGSALAKTIMQSMPILTYKDRGFAPGQVNGVQALLDESGDVNLIIELASSSDTVRWWAEQLKARRSPISLVVGVSAGVEPLTMPYVQSGQVKGLVSGYPGAVAYLDVIKAINTTDQPKQYQVPLEELTLANYVMAALIIIGLLGALLRGAGRRSA